MNTAFFHDCIFINDLNGTKYTTGGLDSKKLSEYVNYFGKMTIFSRERKINENDIRENMSIASTENVFFESITSLKKIFSKNTRNRIRKIISESDFIIIRLPSYIGLIASIEAKKQNKNYLIEMVACPWDALWNYGKISKKICALPTYLLNKIAMRKAPNVIYVSEKFLQKRYPTKGKNIGCSDVVLKDIDNNVLSNRLLKIQKNNSASNLKLCTLANVELKCKGQHFVIKAISDLKKKGINIDYYLAGGGNGNRIAKLAKKYDISENIHILGSLPHDKVFDLLDNIDIYIQPSLQEGLPRSVIEAMSRACPIIASRTGGIPELIDVNCIFKKKNIIEIEKKILQVYNDKEMLCNMSKQNFKKSKEFEVKKLKEKREKFYQEILGEK